MSIGNFSLQKMIEATGESAFICQVVRLIFAETKPLPALVSPLDCSCAVEVRGNLRNGAQMFSRSRVQEPRW